jgi:hypothetical protein
MKQIQKYVINEPKWDILLTNPYEFVASYGKQDDLGIAKIITEFRVPEPDYVIRSVIANI